MMTLLIWPLSSSIIAESCFASNAQSREKLRSTRLNFRAPIILEKKTKSEQNPVLSLSADIFSLKVFATGEHSGLFYQHGHTFDSCCQQQEASNMARKQPARHQLYIVTLIPLTKWLKFKLPIIYYTAHYWGEWVSNTSRNTTLKNSFQYNFREHQDSNPGLLGWKC